ncbi:zinc ABC transporter substrate-binding protein AztC [Glutamicibacter creatinolyticus]|uniref:zinc ABC transporter substrate-binding protein AztC n=1 Tax=Glutamicibacter creatinolyticus TaxID=162496 RepID=UPI0031E3A19E
MSGRFARRLAAAAGLATGLLLAGCTPDAGGSEPPRIVVTTNILGDVTRNMVGDAAEVTTLMKPNADPHSFEISARQAAALGDADLLVANGLGLEEGLERHLETATASGAWLFEAGEHLQAIDYAPDSGSTAADPHFWTDPARMLDVIDALEAELRGIEGIDVGQLEESTAVYRAQVAQLDEQMSSSFAQIPAERRALVTNHHVFGYLAQRFGFRVIGAVIPGGTTLASPSAADLKELADAIRTANVPAIFADSSQPDRLVQALASESGVQVEVIELFTESLTEPGQGAASYLEMMQANTERITRGLG